MIKYVRVLSFNPRAREGRDCGTPGERIPKDKFQSTRPRRARQVYVRVAWDGQEVSIHAPAKGATSRRNVERPGYISFNPRAREGRDKGIVESSCYNQYVSIHAPAKGATKEKYEVNDYWCVSIHAPAKGATKEKYEVNDYWCVSIHAPAKGATGANADNRYGRRVSIHAPAKGATLTSIQCVGLLLVSIHAPAKGAT